MTNEEVLQIPISSLAYLGDAVLEVMVREKLISEKIGKIGDINKEAKKYVTAVAQSAAAERLLPFFTEAETDIFKRGRNHTHSAPKSATHAEYSRATGLECVFAYLHLTGDINRLRELFSAGYGAEE